MLYDYRLLRTTYNYIGYGCRGEIQERVDGTNSHEEFAGYGGGWRWAGACGGVRRGGSICSTGWAGGGDQGQRGRGGGRGPSSGGGADPVAACEHGWARGDEVLPGLGAERGRGLPERGHRSIGTERAPFRSRRTSWSACRRLTPRASRGTAVRCRPRVRRRYARLACASALTICPARRAPARGHQ